MLLDLIFELISGNTPAYILLVQMLFSVVALLLVFPVHECAHGLMALAFGDQTAKYQGRLTLSPLAHIDLRGFLFLMLFGFGWAKPVQIDARYFKNRRLGTILTAAAGPLSNIVFCFITYLIYGILFLLAEQNGVTWLAVFSQLFLYMAIYNATFAVFNLIPFPPLDGSKILGEMLPMKLRFQYYNLERYSYIFFIVLILVLNRTGIVGILSNGLMNLFTPAVNAILGGIFG
ncbi:MAG: site-2 protease family protein [Clostridia bacterium]|nr:site-2 protease family protein [Clostridia bacterium]